MIEVAQSFDQIFVHSDPRILPLDLGRPTPDVIASRLEYTGFVTPRLEGNLQKNAHVLVHAGGGRDGTPFWEAFNRFRLALDKVQFTCCGEQPGELTDHRSVTRLLGRAWRAISMAGYNTVAEWLASRVPTIFVPRQCPEQLTRVKRLQQAVGGPMLVSDATPEALRRAWDALNDKEPFRANVWIHGQEHFANVVRQFFS